MPTIEGNFPYLRAKSVHFVGHLPGVQATLVSIVDLIGGPGCRHNRRKKQPGTDQLVEEGLDWQLILS
jgi:hypothetical protein